MIFGEFRCEDALGVMLAHTLNVGAKTLKKGRVLDARDLVLLREAGIGTVSGARLERDDVAESAAAAEIAALLAGPNTATRDPYTGRCNLHASTRGLVEVDAERIDSLNLLDEAIAIGTLPRHTPVREGQVIATVKIIPFAVPRRLLEACREIASAGPLVRVAEFAPRRAALVMSERPGMKESAFRATVAATRARLEGLGSRLALVLRCPHERGAIEHMLRQALAAGCNLLLVAGATVTKDRNDVVPASVVAAGGVIEHFGMPVEPGNMLLLAHIGPVPVVNLPGCARSQRTNGFDWVLRRQLAGLPLTRVDIMRMGVGGLIRNPLEPDDAGDEEDTDAAASAEAAHARVAGSHDVAALVLAAGRSSRMGGANKLLEPVDGVPMVLRAVNAALASQAASVTVVLGHQADEVETMLAGRAVQVVRNPDHAQGMSSSVRCGLAALPPQARAALVVLGDMPGITADHLDRLIDAFDATRPAIVVPCRQGRRGNPVLLPRELFGEASAVSGDQGARGLIARHAQLVTQVEFDDDAIFVDVDSPDELARVRGAGGGPDGPA
ncbi:MAG: molybdopterin-binding/glycosyltransferase family 2 protein [Burkholderiaceae bacterium]|nr:molybdopterin-binding/glycosyltransferase family 2 protein [Burkholderiaceae bacterium]